MSVNSAYYKLKKYENKLKNLEITIREQIGGKVLSNVPIGDQEFTITVYEKDDVIPIAITNKIITLADNSTNPCDFWFNSKFNKQHTFDKAIRFSTKL